MTWENISEAGPSQNMYGEMAGESKQSLRYNSLTLVLGCTERSGTAREPLPPVTFQSQAAPCRFVRLARDRSSITDRVVQAETPPPPA